MKTITKSRMLQKTPGGPNSAKILGSNEFGKCIPSFFALGINSVTFLPTMALFCFCGFPEIQMFPWDDFRKVSRAGPVHVFHACPRFTRRSESGGSGNKLARLLASRNNPAPRQHGVRTTRSQRRSQSRSSTSSKSMQLFQNLQLEEREARRRYSNLFLHLINHGGRSAPCSMARTGLKCTGRSGFLTKNARQSLQT